MNEYSRDPSGAGLFSGNPSNSMEPYFGVQTMDPPIDPYGDTPNEIQDMSTLYKGKSGYVANTILEKTYEDRDFLFRRILPIEYSTQIHWNWTEEVFPAALLELNAYQTPAALVTSHKRERKMSSVRIGIQHMTENGFLRRPGGIDHLFKTWEQISTAANLTLSLMAVRALLFTHQENQYRMQKMGVLSRNDIRAYQRRRTEQMFCVQKTENCMAWIGTIANKDLRRIGGTADNWIVTGDIGSFLETRPRHMINFDKAGPRGPGRVNERPADANKRDSPDQLATTGEAVYVMRSVPIDGVELNDMMATSIQCGGYFKMFYEEGDPKDYNKADRTIEMYDEGGDRYMPITLEAAIDNANCWGITAGGATPVLAVDTYGDGDLTAEAKDDFLMRVTPDGAAPVVTSPVAYFGDISPVYLPMSALIYTASVIEARMPESLTVARGGNLVIAAYRTMDTLATRTSEAGKYLRSVLGDFDALGVNALGVDASIGERMYTNFMVHNAVPVVGDAPDATSVQSKAIKKLFLDMAPNKTKGKEIASILNDSDDGTLASRIDTRVRAALSGYIQGRVSGIDSSMPGMTVSDVNQNIDAVLADFTSESKSTKKVIGYTAPGRDLTGTGMSYLYDKAPMSYSRVSSSGRAISADQLLAYRCHVDAKHQRDAETRSGTGTSRGAGAGGLANIGTMYYGTPDAPDRHHREPDAESTVHPDLLSKHMVNLDAASVSDTIYVIVLWLLRTPFTRERLQTLNRNNVPIPINFLIMSPYNQYRTHAVIKCAGGGRTGKVMVGHQAYEMSSDTSRMVTIGHFVMHAGVRIVSPQNVWIGRNVYSCGYEGGNGARFWTASTHSVRRLDDDDRPSLICAPLPVAETELPNPLSTSGRYTLTTESDVMDAVGNEAAHYSTSYRISQLYQLRADLTAATDEISMGDADSMDRVWNKVCHQGKQLRRVRATGKRIVVEVNTGPWGYTAPGVAVVRRGGAVFLGDVRTRNSEMGVI